MSEPKDKSKDQTEIARLREIYSERLIAAQAAGDMPSVSLYAKMLSDLIVGGR
jgi:hypothetical protein